MEVINLEKFKNIIGEKFDRLTVVDITDERSKDGSVIWKCQCECGNIIQCSTKKLRNKNTRSCGCLQKEIASNNRRKDLKNMRFGNLVAISQTKEKKHGSIIWECICDCGNRHEVSAEMLLGGKCKSCGCIRSRGNQKVKEILQSININFKPEYFVYINNIRYAFDFAILNNENQVVCFIEYDGILHFEQDSYHGWNDENNWKQTQNNDKIKTKYAEDNNIPLFRIPYTDFNILDKQYITERIFEHESLWLYSKSKTNSSSQQCG